MSLQRVIAREARSKSTPRTTRIACALAATLSAACEAVRPPFAPLPPRQWVTLSSGVIERRGSDADVVNDALAWTLEGGYDMVATSVRIGPEIGVTWSSHDLDIPGADGDPGLDIARWNFGGRVGFDIRQLNSVWYVRGGIYLRDETTSEPDVAQDSSGYYAGAGVEFWFDQTGRMGPFVRWYDSNDTDLEEVLVGLAVTFHF
jgi:hypothetical protein